MEAVERLTTDEFAWVRDLKPGIAPADQIEPFPRFVVRSPFRAEPALSLARGRHVSLCAVSNDPGSDGPRLQAYDDDAIWVVLAGEATFWTEGGREIGCFAQYRGLLAPKGAPYRYENSGDGLLLMLRGAARAEPMEASKNFYTGTNPGGTESISWRRDPWPGVEDHPEPFKRFNLRFPLRGDPSTSLRAGNVSAWRALARAERLAIHSSSLEPGRGEVNLHSHDDEAVWVVLYGQVTYYGGEDDHELCTLRPSEGILIPQDTLYRYVNTGDGYLHMLRFGGRGEPAPPPSR